MKDLLNIKLTKEFINKKQVKVMYTKIKTKSPQNFIKYIPSCNTVINTNITNDRVKWNEFNEYIIYKMHIINICKILAYIK